MQIVGGTTKFKESAVLPFVIPSEAEESAVHVAQQQIYLFKISRAMINR